MPTEEGATPLMVAAGLGLKLEPAGRTQESALQAVMLTVELGNQVQEVTLGNRAALHGAAYIGANEIIKFLVERGADINAEDKFGQTPLSIAMEIPRDFRIRSTNGFGSNRRLIRIRQLYYLASGRNRFPITHWMLERRKGPLLVAIHCSDKTTEFFLMCCGCRERIPSIEGLFCDPHLAAHFQHRSPRLCLLQGKGNLTFRKS